MSRVRNAGGLGVAGDDELVRAEAADGPSEGLEAGAHEDSGVGRVVAAGHLAVGDHKMHALVRACDLGGVVGSRAEVCLEAGHGALDRVAGLRHRVVVELTFAREEHTLPTLRAEPTITKVVVAGHLEF